MVPTSGSLRLDNGAFQQANSRESLVRPLSVEAEHIEGVRNVVDASNALYNVRVWGLQTTVF